MKKWRKAVILVMMALFRQTAEAAGTAETGSDEIEGIDLAFEIALKENYRERGLDLMRESLDACRRQLDANPASYELLWRCARSAIELGETAKILKARDWKTICSSMARKSMEWTDAAKRGSPDRVEAYFWQMKAMGLLYESEGAISFIAKGLAAKSRQNLDACYAIDRSYLDYTPVLAMALYIYSLPPFFGKDMVKALAYFEEYAADSRWSFEPWRHYPCAAELLMSTRKAEDIARARALLGLALADPTPRPFYHELSLSLLARTESRQH
jgi:hypothetical protein